MDFVAFLEEPVDEAAFAPLRRSETTGRPLSAADWIAALERDSGRSLAHRKRGR